MDTPFDTLNGLPGFIGESSPAQHEANLGALLIGTYLGLMSVSLAHIPLPQGEKYAD